MISFAFDNNELLNLLRRRGYYIKHENYYSMKVINDKINAAKKDKNKLNKF